MKFIIIGAGDVGISLAEQLTLANQEVVLIERNEQHVAKIPAHVDAQILVGNGCSSEVLERAAIESADFFIAVADIDEVNAAACLMAKLLNPKAKRIARIRHIDFNESNIDADAVREYFDLIINPDQAGANHLFQLFQAPGANDVVEFVNGQLHVYGIQIAAGASCENALIKDLSPLVNNIPLLIIAIIRDEELIVPHGEDRLQAGDIIYAVTQPRHTNKLFELAGQAIKENRNAIVWGGTILGHFFTTKLQKQGVNVKLILGEDQVTDETLDHFTECLVLQGEGTDQHLLQQENIAVTDAFIAASPHEEDNVLAALLAKQMGAKTVMALVNKRTYMDLVKTIGVDVVVSTQIAAASAIFKHIQPDAVFSESALSIYDTRFLEISILPEMNYVGKAVASLDLPSGVLVVAIVRNNEIIIPKGADTIEAYDKIILFSRRKELKKLSKILSLTFEMQS